MRAACERHLNDLEEGEKRGLVWDVAEVERVLSFFEKVLTVEIEREDPETGETLSEAVSFHLEPWQSFIVGSLFGWKNAGGYRRFRRAYVEVGKGSGKSPIAAGIGHYMLTATQKIRAEVYSAATDKDQAAILFRDAVAMWQRSPELHKRLLASGQNPVWQLTYLKRASFFKPISSEKRGKSGIRPYCALIDEVHEHPNNDVIEMLRAGTKGNRQALIFEITNSGFDRHSVCWSEHEYTAKVVTGAIQNDAWFGYVCSLDESDDPFADESCWIKANPNLGVSIQPEYIREQVEEARGMPSKEALVRRLHFCEWTDAENTWITAKVFRKITAPLVLDDYAGRECFGGLDLSSKRDLTALTLVFTGEDVERTRDEGPKLLPTFDAFTWFWLPKNRLSEAEKRDHVPYSQWAKEGHLRAPEGDAVDYADVARIIKDLSAKFEIRRIGFDPHKIDYLTPHLDELDVDVELVEHSQGYRRMRDSSLWMHESIEETEAAIHEERLRVAFNPILNWNVASAVVASDEANNRKFEKRRSTGRIDGAVSLAMAVGVAIALPGVASSSFWDSDDAVERLLAGEA